MHLVQTPPLMYFPEALLVSECLVYRTEVMLLKRNYFSKRDIVNSFHRRTTTLSNQVDYLNWMMVGLFCVCDMS